MRLLHTTNLRVQEFVDADIPSYAILSHTWGEEESGSFSKRKSFPKLQGACQRAVQDSLEWIWIDTCTIDKTSSADLSEAINSMYTYYAESKICYAHLADIDGNTIPYHYDTENYLKTSRWFTRGWTLQELIAPRDLIFFDQKWVELERRWGLSRILTKITGIPEKVLCGESPFQCNVAQRMSWAANRVTTRKEDVAYCLMGLFEVSMPPLYGEGAEEAFLRLQEEILKRSADQTIFLWTAAHEPLNSGLLASSPQAFYSLSIPNSGCATR
ncbi:HET-domain-containing protein [Microthyrium microscopicum]|uniref:HET-domain-containing protein n=1 Tax=Microthyrium microscopicum TaxID=703497 RepID=A0A6A6TW64_9PEZI|nr:HET-domain-containing protein [Microthyrium microscopicum]